MKAMTNLEPSILFHPLLPNPADPRSVVPRSWRDLTTRTGEWEGTHFVQNGPVGKLVLNLLSKARMGLTGELCRETLFARLPPVVL